MITRHLILFGFMLMAGVAMAGPEWKEQYLKSEFKGSKGGVLQYRFMKPEKTSGPIPLLIFLHGSGERGSDNSAQLKHAARDLAAQSEANPTYVLAPQCPKDGWWSGENLRRVLELIEDMRKEENIDDSRIYITGLSMGGFGTWAAIQQKPDLFAAAAPICGGGDPTKGGQMKDIPIWAFHGAADERVNVEKTREMIQAIRDAGGKPEYTEYPGVKHDSWSQTYRNPEFYKWMFKQQKR